MIIPEEVALAKKFHVSAMMGVIVTLPNVGWAGMELAEALQESFTLASE